MDISSRRSFFKGTSLLGMLGALPGGQRLAMAMAAKNSRNSMKVYTRLGLRPIVNASGTYTHLGGSLMPPEILEAMNDAARHYVPIRDLTKATGEEIARLTGVAGALVATGAPGGIFCGTCASIAVDDPEKMKRLPFTEGMKNQIVLQKLHNTGWTRQCEAAGGRIVEVEEKDQMERAIGNQTAMIYFLIADKHFGQYRDRLDAPGGKVSLEECIRISKAARVPILVDAAAEVPPFDNLSAYTKMGVDLVAFSGGKGVRGPPKHRVLLGRQKLVDPAAPVPSPHNGLGRDFKNSKETNIRNAAPFQRPMKKDQAQE